MEIGKALIYIGVLIFAVGLGVYFFHDRLRWIGHLPGDIAIERENFKFYFPLSTLILLNLVIWLGVRVYHHFKN